MPEPRGCPVCDWRGEVTQTHDRTHTYHTHVIVRDGEIFSGDTCSKRRQPRDPGLLTRLWRWLRAEGGDISAGEFSKSRSRDLDEALGGEREVPEYAEHVSMVPEHIPMQMRTDDESDSEDE